MPTKTKGKLARVIIILLAGGLVSGIGLMLLKITPVTSAFRPWVALGFPAAATLTVVLLWISMAQDGGREAK